ARRLHAATRMRDLQDRRAATRDILDHVFACYLAVKRNEKGLDPPAREAKLTHQSKAIPRPAKLFCLTAMLCAMSAYSVGSATAADEKLGKLIPTMTMVYYAPDAGQGYQQSARILAETFKQLGLDIKL